MPDNFLRNVTERIPHLHYLADRYAGCYIEERLECGHSQIAYPSADPLIARRRLCHGCVAAAHIPRKHHQNALPPKPGEAEAAIPRTPRRQTA